eukprot:CAMPEP_0117737248 /NCGR_PEP_ID=MMETSP0947-20121206/2416_1 /TAXON_ID=44440 /ORGANISM="Chattonella subsalsa, Strain CCMP2191" /LENGTH=184 /DNA_ID=CAMNT_0005552701 /DNA_START=443 /DNA_END=994 /DNA_ORIENTATION=+
MPNFLYILIIGAMIHSYALIPLANDDFGVEIVSLDGELDLSKKTPGLDNACASIPWIYLTGFSLQFTALFAKVIRIKKLVGMGKAMKKIKLRFKDYVPILGCSVTLMWIFCGIQMLIAPLHWQRFPTAFDSEGNLIQSYGICYSKHFLPFFAGLVLFQIAGLVQGIRLNYEARDIEGEFVESKW